MASLKVEGMRAGTLFILSGLALVVSGCTSVADFVGNGCKLGPNYRRPPAPLAAAWIEGKNPHVKAQPADDSAWWNVFADPVLDDLVKTAYEQNVGLRIAATRVLEARAQQAIAVGEMFPQQQAALGAFTHTQVSRNLANVPPRRFFDDWATGFGVSWEVDFWGKIRRNIESATDAAQASVDDYDHVMVTLIADVAAAYVQYRIFQQQVLYTRKNADYQRALVKIATSQWKAGQKGELPVAQATSLLQQLESLVALQELGLRQANNLLCVLLGMPPVDLAAKLGEAPIPDAPPEVVVGIPADLIRRRPDLRAAERLVAAQNAQIGVAQADFYPAFFITGNLGYEAKDLARLFSPNSFTGQIGPAFQWNILNYGRILNNVRLQDFQTQELVSVYQQKVLSAAQEVENGIATFLNSKRQAESLFLSKKAADRTVTITTEQWKAGAIDLTAEFVAQQFLAQVDIQYAQAKGDVALGLIGVYRALGGGWQLRLQEPPPPAAVLGRPL